MLQGAHVAPLTKYVENLRGQRGGDESIPYFDPTEAGIEARILVLLEAPGPKASHGSRFVSADNDDPTAENMWRLYQEASIDRSRDVVAWNVCPWYVGTGGKIRAVNRNDMAEARPHVEALLELLGNLRVVILLGRKAQTAWKYVGSDLERLESWHPSPRGLAGHPGRRDEILSCLVRARPGG